MTENEESVEKALPEKSFAADLADLASARFVDTQIGHHTEIWNALQAFKVEIVDLHERHLHAA